MTSSLTSAPDNLRLGIAPLYTSFTDIYEGLTRLQTVNRQRRYEKYPVSGQR